MQCPPTEVRCMSSLHQDRLLVEESEPVRGARTTLATAREKGATAEEKAPSKVPVQRQGTAQRSRTTPTASDVPAAAPRSSHAVDSSAAAATSGATGTLSARAKAARKATAKAAAAKARTVRAATAKVATEKAASARTATTKAAAAAKTVAAAKAASRTAERTARTSAAHVPAAGAPVVTATADEAAPVAAKTAASAPAAKPASRRTTAPKTAAPKTAAGKAAASEAVAQETATKPTAPKATATKATGTKAAPAPGGSAVKDATSAPTAAALALRATPYKRTAAAETKADAPAPARRPTPYKRTPVDATVADAPTQSPVAAEVVAVPAAPLLVEAPVVERAAQAEVAAETGAAAVVAAVAEGRRPGFLRRRPALYLAAALVGAMGISTFAVEDLSAKADTASTTSSSVSVAHELGLTSRSADSLTAPGSTDRLMELTASRSERDAEQAAAWQAQAAADAEATRPKAVLPVAGARLTSTFRPRWGPLHAGIDLAAPIGTPEYAAMDGVVLEAGPASGFGLAVYIQHQNGDVTVYGHMNQILVSAGQVVKAGDPIALLGNRGQSTGPHLHFEVHAGGIDGPKIDPLPWLRERGIAI